MEIYDQNFLYGLPVDSKLLTSPTHRLVWAADSRVSDRSNVVSMMISVVQSVIVSVFTIEVMHSPLGSELVDPYVDH